MTHLRDLFDLALFREMREAGYVRQQLHPKLPLVVANYTDKATYDNVWNDVTRQCRGLIYKTEGLGQVVARPFPKFFNYGQEGAPELDLDEKVHVLDKLDGSLGILYGGIRLGKFGIATRGSFTSDQALHATDVLQRKYGDWVPQVGYTYLFEILYPENKIVVDYGDLDDIVLIEVLETKTGLPLDDGQWNFPGPYVDFFEHHTLGDALVAEPRPNAEGFVIYIPSLNERVKIKQEDYVKLHWYVTHLSARKLWKLLCEGQETEEIVAPLPDEFHPWAREVCDNLIRDARRLEKTYIDDFVKIVTQDLLPDFTRKDFALYVERCPYKGELFALLDGKNIFTEILKKNEPPADLVPRQVQTEDTA